MIRTIIEYVTVAAQTPLAECTPFQLFVCAFLIPFSFFVGVWFGTAYLSYLRRTLERDLQNMKNEKDGD